MAYGNPYFQNYPYTGNYPQMGAVPDLMGQYKAPYQQAMAMQNPQQMPMQNAQAAGNDMIWVQGEAGMKAYFVAPNCTVTLWDSENPVIYLKSADANGVPSTRTLDWTERTTQKPLNHVCQCAGKYASAEEVRAMADEIAALKKQIEGMNMKDAES